MAVVSDQTIAAAALAGGFPRDKVATAVAVALAESGGNATATNRNANGSTDYGLWQINSVHSADLASGDWRDPTANARMAFAVYSRQGWAAWYAWRNGRHLAFMGRGQLAAINANANGAVFPIPTPDIPTPDVPNPVEGAKEVLSTLDKILDVLGDKNFWIRAGMFAAGALILVAAIYGIFKSMGGETRVTEVAKVVTNSGGKK